MTDSNNRSTSPKPVSCATVPDGAKRTAAGSSAAKTVIASIWHTGGGKYAMIVIGLWVAVSAISLFWTPYRLLDTDGYHVWASPSGSHPLGTDGVGSDVLSWLMAGSRTNLAIALLTVCVAAAVGLLLVAAMVSRNSAFASTSVVVVDALISLPTVLIALILTVPFGASAAVIVISCGFAYGMNLARILRPAAMLAARSPYVIMGRGQSDSRVLYAYPAEHPACAQRAAFHQRRHLAACRGGIDLPWRGRRFGRSQLGALAVHVGQIHQHLSYGRAMAGSGGHCGRHRVEPFRRCAA